MIQQDKNLLGSLNFDDMKDYFSIPENRNLTRNTRAKLFIQRCPNSNFFCSSFTLPQLSIQTVDISTSSYSIIHEPGEQYTLEPLTITLLVDENFENWLELLRWMHYIVKNGAVPASYSNALAIIYDSELNAILSIRMFNLFPTNLGPLEFNVAESQPLQMTISFSLVDFEVENILDREIIFGGADPETLSKTSWSRSNTD